MFPVFQPSWAALCLIALSATQLTIFCVTLYLHRSQAHRALTLHPAAAHFARAWLWLTTSMSTMQWVAVHRKHHAFCETDQDPHSPRTKGFWTVMLKGTKLYHTEANNATTVARYSKGAPSDWLELQVYQRLSVLGPVLLMGCNLVLFGLVKGAVLSAVQLMWIPVWAAGVINAGAHTVGYRNFETADASTNLLPWGIWIGGEELHNNHHAHPTSAKLSYRAFEVDIGWGAICLLKLMGLAQVHKVARPLVESGQVQSQAKELLLTLASHQHQVSVWFETTWKQAILEFKRGGAISANQARLLQSAIKGPRAGDTVLALLAPRQSLSVLLQQWYALQPIWTNKTASVDELALLLEQWCENAETSGVAALREFAFRLRCLRAPGR